MAKQAIRKQEGRKQMKAGTLYASGPLPGMMGLPSERGWRIYRVIDDWDEELIATVPTKHEAEAIVKNQRLAAKGKKQ
jgi:hypothetical protein